ncbi:hypothetical protein BDN72DRAFT_893496 [Pluteus cervinus]|uniref:Uncharacterized protein n=1 Tax=Pluteus cervinus TaxID=181527 RepID=A0ACD3B7E3_9AGAR|nr:hypothetical protein BDN72DRAFT_893496 [Pluteus cervinus]
MAIDIDPSPAFRWLSLSLLTSTIAVIFAALSIRHEVMLSTVPAAYAMTIGQHVLTYFNLRSTDPAGKISTLYSMSSVYIAIAAWVASAGVLLTSIVLTSTGRTSGNTLWILIVSCSFTFIECGIILAIAIWLRKQRARVLYAAKWAWRIDPKATTAQWSSPHVTIHDPIISLPLERHLVYFSCIP